ncbi:MAG: ABC transporter ATP-binding protein [Sedimentisphaerales bacterium]|nr:ABC transporter ATP-binding protein [Sedimentisphaerales bacterium]
MNKKEEFRIQNSEARRDIILRAEKLCKTFRNGALETQVLFDLDLQIERGEFVAIMGPSGCGKSTLMHILGLMLSPTAGRVVLDGQNAGQLSDSRRARLRREKIGFVFQRFNLLGTVNAYQNLAIAERVRGNKLDGQITTALEAVDMVDRARHKPGQLSIGQQQRIAIARAICHRPALLLADEPTGNLDSGNTRKILDLFTRIHNEYGLTIVMITHSPTVARAANRIIHMADGRITDAPAESAEHV